MTSRVPQPLETDGPANGSQGHPHTHTQTAGSPRFIYWVLHPTSSCWLPCFPVPRTHWDLDLSVLTTGPPTTQLTDPETPTTGAHIPVSKHSDSSSLRHQVQGAHTTLGPRSPIPPADPRSPCFKPWISNFGHWILDIKKPQPPHPDSEMPRSWGPHTGSQIPSPQPLYS